MSVCEKVEPEEPLLDPEELMGLIPEDNSKVKCCCQLNIGEIFRLFFRGVLLGVFGVFGL